MTYISKQMHKDNITLAPLTNILLEKLAESRQAFSEYIKRPLHPQYPNKEFEEALPFFLEGRKNNPDEEKWNFLIIDNNSGMVVGGIGVKKAPSDTFEIEVGYGIVEDMRGKGLATEALKLFIDYCFNSGFVKTIKAECLESNHASIRILNKIGFKRLEKSRSEEGMLILWSLKQFI